MGNVLVSYTITGSGSESRIWMSTSPILPHQQFGFLWAEYKYSYQNPDQNKQVRELRIMYSNLTHTEQFFK